ncbi:hypothetical protein [Streptomyces indicus]|uniref:PknH-like extracellular domain-containing protein n=1 Tax=Streptomyces indicus TaxID=417292 RepID=A0A1G9DBZ6_9ACTN|nr:hypothetical protein [Streptomyces indicus]SDK61353.1 hypothetical protein SAMN05421806_109136 [Streptomyces indicus]
MRTTPRRGAIAALAVSSLLFAAACGGSGGSGDKPSDGKQKKESATPSPEAKPLTRSQAEAAALVLKDMPSGWSQDKSMTDTEDGSTVFGLGKAEKKQCQPLLDQIVHHPGTPAAQATVAKSYNKSDLGPYLSHGVFSYTAEDALEAMKNSALPTGCDKFTVDFEGDKATFTYKKLDVPAVGDETLAWRLIGVDEQDQVPMQFDFAASRVGSAISVTLLTSVDNKSDTPAFKAAFEKGAQRVAEAVKAAK